MKPALARMAWIGLLALALPSLAQAQSGTPRSLGGGGPKVAAVDPATVQGLASLRDYRPPQDVVFKAADFISENVRLTAQWFYAAENQGRTLPTVIVAPGWGATAASLRQDAVELARAGYLVMLFDYRGWGDSDGRVMLVGAPPATGGPAAGTFKADVRELRGYIDPWEQVEDWFNAFSYAAAEPMADAGRIGVLGADLSGGQVIYLAAHEPRVRALVSQVSVTDTRPYKPYQPDPAKVIAQANAAASALATGQAAYPAERARALNAQGGGPLGPTVGSPVGAKVVRWAPVEQAGRVTAPALFVLAKNEELFSNTNNGQAACERVMGPRKLVMLSGITHYGVYGAERARAMALTIDWFDRYLKAAKLEPGGAPTRTSVNRKEPERGECNPPPEPPKGEEDPNGSGQGHKAQDASSRFN